MPATPPERMTPRRACVLRPFGRLPSSSLSLADDMRLPSEAARALLACARRADSSRPDPIDPNHHNHDGSEPSEAGFVASWMGLWVHIFLNGVCIHVCVDLNCRFNKAKHGVGQQRRRWRRRRPCVLVFGLTAVRTGIGSRVVCPIRIQSAGLESGHSITPPTPHPTNSLAAGHPGPLSATPWPTQRRPSTVVSVEWKLITLVFDIAADRFSWITSFHQG